MPTEQNIPPSPEPSNDHQALRGIKRTSEIPLSNTQEKNAVTLTVSVSQGDLHYAAYPVLAGHFLNDGILFAEKAIDRYLKGALSERHRLAIYPGEIGTSEIMPGGMDFKGAVIIGLGKQGDLTAFRLAQTVEQGVTKYLLDYYRRISLTQEKLPETLGISSVIIGCGFGGLPVENSVRAIIEGIQQANRKVHSQQDSVCLIQALEFIELYDDTALSCLYAVNKIEREEGLLLNILAERKIKLLFGSQKRLPLAQGANWWNRITVQEVQKLQSAGDVRCLLFSASTGGAREEQRELYSSTAVVKNLIETLSVNENWSPDLARTIFELLIPNDFKEQLKHQGNINWILDKATAAYPWELLQEGTAEAIPFCVNGGMIRQLTTQDYRLRIDPVTIETALVVGDPDLKGFAAQLPGARAEGEAVTSLLKEQDFQVEPVINGEAAQIIQALFLRDYKFVHLAGHGIFEEKASEDSTDKIIVRSGMVIGNDIYLSTREIVQMSRVPELVFVNCCYLGQVSGATEAFYHGRYKLAANIGTQLIENGVKAVVVAGWAVDDAAALEFTQVFYKSLFSDSTFGEAVQKARRSVFEKYKRTNTWGAYQCYGDPFYKLRIRTPVKKAYQPEFLTAAEVEIELYNLGNELETGNYRTNDIYARMAAVAQAVDKAGLRNAAITEKEALMYSELGDYDAAVSKFESLLKMEKARFTVSSLEKYCNVRIKKYVADFSTAEDKAGFLPMMDQVICELEILLSMGQTAERLNLLGSAYKRKAFLSPAVPQKVKVYKAAASFYRKAQELEAEKCGVYALVNLLEIQGILVAAGKNRWNETIHFGRDTYLVTSGIAVKQLLEKASTNITTATDCMDYWDLVNRADIQLCMQIVDPVISSGMWENVRNGYRDAWILAGTKAKKLTAIEHLEWLADGLSLSKKQGIMALRNQILQFTSELKKLVEMPNPTI